MLFLWLLVGEYGPVLVWLLLRLEKEKCAEEKNWETDLPPLTHANEGTQV